MTGIVEGRCVVLDGMHRLNLGTASLLLRLLDDREVTAFDGRKFISKDRFQKVRT